MLKSQDAGDAFLPTSVLLATDKSIPFDATHNTIEFETSVVGPFSVVDGHLHRNMIVAALTPPPAKAERFQRKNARFIPERSGCYVLSTFEHVVLYVGLASNLRRRMNQHLDSEAKTALTEWGRAAWFHWIEGDATHQIERTWLNTHITHEGRMPALNKIFSPISM